MNKTLYIMVGPPAAGKSYFAKNHLVKDDTWAYVSRDEVRFSIITEEDKYFSKEKEVFKSFVKIINTKLKDPYINYVIADATHLNFASRAKLMKSITITKKVDIIPVVVTADIQTILERNSKREGLTKLPEQALKGMYARFIDPADDNFSYTAIMYVNTGKKEKKTVDKPKILYTKAEKNIKEVPIKK